MNSIILLLIVIALLYFYNNKYPFEEKTRFYILIGIIIYIVFIYFMNYQKNFVYKMAKNLNDVQKQPLHTLLPDFQPRTINGNNIKYIIADKQNLKCYTCKNTILLDDLEHYKLSYITPLQIGGINEHQNLKLLCPSCYQFRQY